MSPEKWDEIKLMVQKNFGVEENTVLDLPAEQGGGQKESLIFKGPLGKMKLEFISKPLVIDKKTIYSNRAGQQTKVEYITSDTEKVNTFVALKWDEAGENWVEIDSAQFE